MPLFKKKPHPVWFVLRPKKSSSSTSDPKREGPYTRAAITQMYGEGLLGDGALIWTNEKIFPNAEKPNSFRPVRIMEWRRLDQLPDPVVRQLDAEWQEMKHQQNAPTEECPQSAENPGAVPNSGQMQSHDPSRPNGAPPPPTGGTATMAVQPQHSAPSSMYPAGVALNQNPNMAQVSSHPSSVPSSPPPLPPQTYTGHSQTAPQVPVGHSQVGAFQQSSAYPASAAYPSPAPGAY